MAKDLKYGHVTLEHGSIGEDEPVMIFRAKDRLLPGLINLYLMMCQDAGSPQRHLDLVAENRDIIQAWQKQNLTKTPDSMASTEWMDH
jgi:hypothetical protein